MKVLVYNGALNEKHIQEIEEASKRAGVELCFTSSENDIPEGFEDSEVVYGYGMNLVNADKIRGNKNLKWISMISAGIDYALKPGFFANENVIITNSSGTYGVTIAEHIIAVSLMMMRKLTLTYASSLQGKWGSLSMQKSLKDCHITVLGTGDIGTCFAKRVKAFEPAEIIGVSRSGKNQDSVYDKMYSVDQLDEVLPGTELLVMSLPGTTETEGILSRERISLLPEGAYIVNVGRGSAIDYDALMESLNSERLGGAALDVFKVEPLPEDSPLWTTKNILITPHSAGNLTLDYTRDKNVHQFCENLMNYVEGKPLQHVVDKVQGY